MKKLPDVNESFDDLYRILITPVKSKLLIAGMGSDFIHDPIGEGYDLIWTSSVLSPIRSRTLDTNERPMDLDIGRKV